MPALAAVRFLVPGLPRLDPVRFGETEPAQFRPAKVTKQERALGRHQPGGRPALPAHQPPRSGGLGQAWAVRTLARMDYCR